jgi:hypothetical protein
MCALPGGCEWLMIIFVGLLVYAIPVIFAVVVLVYLSTIRKAVNDVQARLDRLEQK